MNRQFVVNIVIGVGLASSVCAQVDCGATLEGGTWVMTADALNCASTPALVLNDGAEVDMNGHILTCGANTREGIVINGSGGSVKNGKVSGCLNGIKLLGEGRHSVTRMVSANNAANGVYAGSDGNTLTTVYASGNTLSQIYIEGAANKVIRANAAHGADGIHIKGDKNKVVDSSASNNTNGFVVESGSGNSFKGCVASQNDDGFQIHGVATKIKGSVAAVNGDDAFSLDGSKNSLSKSVAVGNGYGITVGFDSGCSGCTVSANRVAETAGWSLYTNGAANVAVKNELAGGTNGLDLGGGDDEEAGTTAAANIVLGAQQAGIYVHDDLCTITKNVTVGSGEYDLKDQNSMCADNTWNENLFATRLQGCEQ